MAGAGVLHSRLAKILVKHSSNKCVKRESQQEKGAIFN
jgi:hypothetical protein